MNFVPVVMLLCSLCEGEHKTEVIGDTRYTTSQDFSLTRDNNYSFVHESSHPKTHYDVNLNS